MVPVIIFQLVLSIIHEWVTMIYSHLSSIQVFNTTHECCPPWDFYWHIHYYFSANIFFMEIIVNVVLIGKIFRHHVPILFLTQGIVPIPMCRFIGFIYVVNIEISPDIINKVRVIQPFL